MSRPGIELRVSNLRGVVLQSNSDMLYNIAGMIGWDNPECWSTILQDHTEAVKIQIRQVELPDLDVDQADEVAAAEPVDQTDPEPEPGLYVCSGCGWRFERRTAMGSVWRGAMWGDKFGGQHGGPYSWDELTDGYADCVDRLVRVDEGSTARAMANLLERIINAYPNQMVGQVRLWRQELARLRP